MQEQRIIIIAPNSYEKEYAEKLHRRVNASGYTVFLWEEDSYKERKSEITDDDKLIFFGKARKIEKNARTKNVRIKFDKFGMRYGWAGNICSLYVYDTTLLKKNWDDFVDYCQEMRRKYYDIQIPDRNVLKEDLNVARKKDNAGYRCQYAALLLEFFDRGGFRQFMEKANTSNPAYVRIVEQLPDVSTYDKMAASRVWWKTLENRSGYKIEESDDKDFYCFRILNEENKVIAWGNRDYEELGIMAFLALFGEKTIKIVEASNTGKEHEVVYKTQDSLEPIRKILEEADEALKDKNRTIKDSSVPGILVGAIPDVYAGFAGAGVGAIGSFIALYYLGIPGLSAIGITTALKMAGGIIGGGMAAGIFVLGAPIAILAATSVGIVGRVKEKEIKREKECLLQNAIEKQQAIIERLNIEIGVEKQRADYLNSLNEVLRRAIADLRADLGA